MEHHHHIYNQSTRLDVDESILAADLLLFDLDGLLVDSEVFHWKAYQLMVEQFGYKLSWDYLTYLKIAGSASHAVRDRLKEDKPELFERHTWEEMYAVKKEKVAALLESQPIPLMPGVERVVLFFAKKKKRMAVVTHSPKSFVEKVRSSHEIFSLFYTWVYREMYANPKPAPDGYIEACAFCKVAPERAVGFEDSWRGIEALLAAGCQPVLVNARDAELRKKCENRSILSVSSFMEFHSFSGD